MAEPSGDHTGAPTRGGSAGGASRPSSPPSTAKMTSSPLTQPATRWPKGARAAESSVVTAQSARSTRVIGRAQGRQAPSGPPSRAVVYQK